MVLQVRIVRITDAGFIGRLEQLQWRLVPIAKPLVADIASMLWNSSNLVLTDAGSFHG